MITVEDSRTMPHLDGAVSLNGFPARPLRKGTILYKAHLIDTEPIWFSASGHGFDLPAPSGSMYASTDRDHAVSQLLSPIAGRYRSIVVEQARKFVVTPVIVRRPYRLAAIDHSSAAKFGRNVRGYADGRTITTPGQEWAIALAREGFDGLLFAPRVTGNTRATMVVLFGSAGAVSSPSLEIAGESIPGPQAAKDAGFSLVPTQIRAHLDVI